MGVDLSEFRQAQHDLEAVRAMLGHVPLETTQIHAQIFPAQLKRASPSTSSASPIVTGAADILEDIARAGR